MTEESKRLRGKRLPREILGLLSLSFVITLILLLRICATAVADSILVIRGIVLTESKVLSLEGWMFNLSLLISVCFFTFLFLFLLGERLSYIWDIIKGIDALRLGEMDHLVSVEGNNELTRLAEAVNYLSITQKQVKDLLARYFTSRPNGIPGTADPHPLSRYPHTTDLHHGLFGISGRQQ